MATFDVLCIGNAIVDILSRTDDSFLETNGIVKGAMNLIDADRAELLYSRIAGPATEMSGGSAGNTAAGVASLGGRSAYFGKVAADHLGRVFAHDIRAQGVAFDTRPLENGSPTARSMIFVTPDGERSMNTFLGACVELGPEDVETSKVSDAKVTYFEGYLWDPPRAKEAIVMASKIAHEKNRQMAMTLSDPFCVDRYRGEFLELMRSRTVDIVFANEDEAKSLYKTKSLETAIACMRMDCALSIITRSEKGAVVVTPDQTLTVPAIEIDALVDTTGAGDLYAAGFLYGYTNDRSLEDCARLGSLAAGMIIQQMGPRPQVSLQAAASQAGLV
ncbi:MULTISPECIES: adenosine kinase [Brucella/Ochrobactrum group]|jgi:sugar/nucleoside kinase (ribokinase family)|uniref:Adenosine kinase n=1 Tax=Brucella pseudintermedia TaxID=370111 RepID=A0ABY5U969_9HYPH|nr:MULTISPECIES: adenosine kinase [Brucella/Ochrobactrum group]KAB2681840.1 adenosine kinase [Brucella pseudintermedia]MCO7725232.1 adenosine kinase [Brucella intermedia]NKE75987.1 adenosine kinase [Ochrobactrum sp. MC-1LL]TWH00442.1 sugar/nucleoside kinase (ribokinase family) [Ochrobactrum sp. J50]UWL59885.1 adenosine kinase [Brucella pseudintermedia]